MTTKTRIADFLAMHATRRNLRRSYMALLAEHDASVDPVTQAESAARLDVIDAQERANDSAIKAWEQETRRLYLARNPVA